MTMATSQKLDVMLRTLADNRRRYVLYYLEDVDKTAVELTEVTEQLVRWEREWDGTTDLSQSKHREHMQVDLHHHHLPRLAEANLVEYDPRSEMLRQWESGTIQQCVEANAKELNRLFDVFNLPEAAP